MVLEIGFKKEDPNTLILSWDGEIWRNVSKSLFFSELRKISSAVTRGEFEDLFAQIEEKVGKRYAFSLLSRCALFSVDLEAKLIAKGLSPRAAQRICAYCVQLGYIDDPALCEGVLAREVRKGRSPRAALFRLKHKKGLNEEVLAGSLQSAIRCEEDALKKWLEKNGRKMDWGNPVARRKWMAKLVRRGFSAELVLKVCEMDDN